MHARGRQEREAVFGDMLVKPAFVEKSSVVRIISVDCIRRLFEHIGLSEIIAGISNAIEEGFRRWPEVLKTLIRRPRKRPRATWREDCRSCHVPRRKTPSRREHGHRDLGSYDRYRGNRCRGT
jgi:hypothetical protein